MDEAFASLMVQPPTVHCVGVEMRPFSLGHYLLLSHERSPFVSDGALPLFGDLIYAAFVCRHGWRDNLALRRSRFGRLVILRTWGLLMRRFNIAEEIARMALYVRGAMEMPPVKETDNGRYLFSDWSTRVFAHLLSLGYTEAQAMDTPLAVANRLFIAHIEQAGLAEFKVKRDDKYTRAMSRILDAEDEKERSLTA
jgi:hypothetical protein